MPKEQINNTSELKDFFISYTDIDRPYAEWIASELEQAQYRTIIQAWDFRPGCNFIEEMDKATQIAKRTIVVLSPHYLESKYARDEWTVAFQQRKLIPIRIKSFNIVGLLSPIGYIDLIDQNEEQARQKLLKGILPGRAKPSTVLFPGF